jgi:outer membrane protein assembly factor BamB
VSAPKVELISSTTAARLEQARALAAETNWNEAVDIFRELAAVDTSRVVDLGDGRYVSLRTYCHMQLARLPKDALSAYRRRADAIAELSYHEGLAERDERLLRRIVDEFYCSSWGDDALLALGELALERGDYAAARRYWEQISPLLCDTNGLPMWLASHGSDQNTNSPQIEPSVNERTDPPHRLAYPDTTLNLADARARLILVSIRAGDLKRAAFELEAFSRLHANAAGRIGGQEGPYVAALQRLVSAAKDWPAEPHDSSWRTFAGSPSRSPAMRKLGPIIGPAWAEPVSFTPTLHAPHSTRITLGGHRLAGDIDRDGARPMVRDSDLPLTCFPISVDGLVLYSDENHIYAADLATGKPAVTRDGVLYRGTSTARRSGLDGRGFRGRWDLMPGVSDAAPRHTLTETAGIVYGRVGRPSATRIESDVSARANQLGGLELGRDGQLAFRARPDDDTWEFDGAPVGEGHRVFVAMRQSDVTRRVYVACFDAASESRPLWRTPIGAADAPAAGDGEQFTHNLLTLVGDRIYFNTNLGLVATLDASNGDICWIRRYPRQTSQPDVRGHSMPTQISRQRDPSPCLYHDGLVIAAPVDSPSIFALDAATGQMVWSTDMLTDAAHLLGVVRRNLIVSGNHLSAVDVSTGKLKFVWPKSDQTGLRGMGRGIVAGDEVFWPTRSEIHVIHGVTGAQCRNPIRLGTISDRGANLAAANGRLIVAGPDKLTVFGPALPFPPHRDKVQNQKPVTAIVRLPTDS